MLNHFFLRRGQQKTESQNRPEDIESTTTARRPAVTADQLEKSKGESLKPADQKLLKEL